MKTKTKPPKGKPKTKLAQLEAAKIKATERSKPTPKPPPDDLPDLHDRCFESTNMTWGEKNALADNVSFLTGSDMASYFCKFREGYLIPDENNNDRPETLEHSFVVTVEVQEEFWVSGRDGDLRLLIAEGLQKRADALMQCIRELRRHHTQSATGCKSLANLQVLIDEAKEAAEFAVEHLELAGLKATFLADAGFSLNEPGDDFDANDD